MNTITFPVSATAFKIIERNSSSNDETWGAWEAHQALRETEGHPTGRGVTYTVTVSPSGAAFIENYCQTVGKALSHETGPEVRRKGQALLKVADRIKSDLLSLED